MRYLTAAQKQQYEDNGFLLLRNVVPEQLLLNAQRPLERFVDKLVNVWKKKNLLDNDFSSEDFFTRLNSAWNAAGRPEYNPNPKAEIVSPEVFDVIRFPLFVDIACDLMETQNVDSTGLFHCRPKLPDQYFTDTPWHQDAQCHPPMALSKFVIMWMPFQQVFAENSCLEFAPGLHRQGLFKNYKDPNGYYISMRPEDVETLGNTEVITMNRGDLLVFNESVPHRATRNQTDSVRWSLDFRFEPHKNPYSLFTDKSFSCANENADIIVGSYDEWLKKIWKDGC